MKEATTMSSLPSESDRKTFIGCLSAILASSYDYDQKENDEIDTDSLLLDKEIMDSDTHNPLEPTTSPGSSPSRSNSASFWGVSSVEQFRISQIATRKRRYELLTGFLLSSAELLHLDKDFAVGLVPIIKEQFLTRKSSKESLSDDEHSDNSSGRLSPAAMSHLFPYLPQEIAQDDKLVPFLDNLNNGLECLCLLIIQHLRTSIVGYDARIRHAIRKLGILIILKEMVDELPDSSLLPSLSDIDNKNNNVDPAELLDRATRKYEALERAIAIRMIVYSKQDASKEDQQQRKANGDTDNRILSRKNIIRGMKVGSVAVVGGTLFALSGGLAGPAFAATIGAVLGSAAAASATAVTLTSSVVLSTIFGVGGGSLTVYKMTRRTQGLQEFALRQEYNRSASSSTNDIDEDNKRKDQEQKEEEKNDQEKERKSDSNSDNNKTENANNQSNEKIEAELSTAICLSGWIIRKTDYQQPWGIEPTSPPITDPLQLLERFYHIHAPENVPKCPAIVAEWKSKEDEMFDKLQQAYGTDPKKLYPLGKGPLEDAALDSNEDDMLDELFSSLGLKVGKTTTDAEATPMQEKLSEIRARWVKRHNQANKEEEKDENVVIDEVGKVGETEDELESNVVVDDPLVASIEPLSEEQMKKYETPKHLTTLWDYKSTYGGELYTATFETDSITRISRCFEDFAMNVGKDATKMVLQETALATLLSAISLPSYLSKIADIIDNDFTLAAERADQAGRELAQNLLYNNGGNRPVTLVGYSFGARIVYECVKELARMQQEWEEYRDLLQQQAMKKNGNNKNKKDNDKIKENIIEGTGDKELDDKFKNMREPASIVEDVILMGLPQHRSLLTWKRCRQVVSGRFVNCYSRNDRILSFMYQFRRFEDTIVSGLSGGGVCGACQVNVPGVENVDITDLVSDHKEYCNMTKKILDRVHYGQPFVALQPEKHQEEETTVVVPISNVAEEEQANGDSNNNDKEISQPKSEIEESQEK